MAYQTRFLDYARNDRVGGRNDKAVIRRWVKGNKDMTRQEIEVKARARDLEAVAQKLHDLGCTVSEPREQDDAIFINFVGSYIEFRSGAKANFLRIRKTNGKNIFTIKQAQTNELDVIEYETEIADAEQMRQALLLMGYREVMRIRKVRRKANYRDYEICLDDVDGLGSYVEAEKISEGADSQLVQQELLNFLVTLGIKPEDREEHGYDTLLYLRQIKVA